MLFIEEKFKDNQINFWEFWKARLEYVGEVLGESFFVQACIFGTHPRDFKLPGIILLEKHDQILFHLTKIWVNETITRIFSQ